MRTVLDTNVLISGIFFSGVPYQIISAWRNGKIELAVEATLVAARPLAEGICSDPDDDKFLACALASKVKVVCSGDRALLRTSGYRGIEVLTPRNFAERFLDL